MKLYAISDLHLNHADNRAALVALPPQPDDWLVLAGDVGDSPEHLRLALQTLAPRFAQLFWVPGNHELWAAADDPLRGVGRYEHLVALCREYGVRTPEDEYLLWPAAEPRLRIAPLFVLYDYSFHPDEVPPADALRWAADAGIVGTDEHFLHPDPYPTRAAWCEARCMATEARLAQAAADAQLVLINHFPLRRHHAWLPRVPRFSIWCGTRRTEDWHRRFRARAVVYGHLHIRNSRVEDGVHFDEVSLGYPRDWDRTRGLTPYLRRIL